MSLLQSIIPLVARFSRNERYQIPVEGHMRHPPIGGGGKQSGWDSIIASRLVIDRFQDAGRRQVATVRGGDPSNRNYTGRR